MNCPHCNQWHENHVRFCPATGRQIVAFECPHCSEVVLAESHFCTSCGKPLSQPAGHVYPPPPQPPGGTYPPNQGEYTGFPPGPKPKSLPTPLLVLIGMGGLLLLVGVFFVLYGLLSQNKPEEFTETLEPFQTRSATITTAPGGGQTDPAALTQTARAQITTTRSPTPTLLPVITVTPSRTPTLKAETPPPCTAVGQLWMRQKDGAVMLCVPAGSFTIGQRSCGYTGCEKEVNGGSVSLPGFWMDRTEVTNAMFKKFVADTNFVTGAERGGAANVYGINQPVPGADWRRPQGSSSSINGKDDHPVVQINWYAANAYCQWAAARLPTEAQWEKAARGTDGRLFPWGNDLPTALYLNYADANLPVPWAMRDQNDGFRYTSPVGKYPAGASPYGVLDLSGNAWEWTRSLYRDYPYRLDDGRELNIDPPETEKVTIRGGCWYDDFGSVRATLRYGGKPDQSTDGTGFRCVMP